MTEEEKREFEEFLQWKEAKKNTRKKRNENRKRRRDKRNLRNSNAKLRGEPKKESKKGLKPSIFPIPPSNGL